MKAFKFKIPVSLKAISGFATTAVVGGIEKLVHLNVSQPVSVWIAGGIGLGVAYAVPEGAAYLNKWLKDRGLPAEVLVTARQGVARRFSLRNPSTGSMPPKP